METGPEELSDNPDERAEELDQLTDRPLDDQGGGDVEGTGAEDEPSGSGHRIAGTGSSADTYPLKDQGETGGASHPKPKDPSERSERLS